MWTGAVYDLRESLNTSGDAPFCRHQPGDGGIEFTHVYAIGRVKRCPNARHLKYGRAARYRKHLNQYNKVGGKHYALANENNFECMPARWHSLQVLNTCRQASSANAITVSNAEEGKSSVMEGDFCRGFNGLHRPRHGQLHSLQSRNCPTHR